MTTAMLRNTCLLAVLLLLASLPVGADIIDGVKFAVVDENRVSTPVIPSGKLAEAPLPSTIEISVDRDKFVSEVNRYLKLVSADNPLETRIEKVQAGVGFLIRLDAAFAAAKSAYISWQVAEQAVSASRNAAERKTRTENAEVLKQKLSEASCAVSEFAKDLRAIPNLQEDPAIGQALIDAATLALDSSVAARRVTPADAATVREQIDEGKPLDALTLLSALSGDYRALIDGLGQALLAVQQDLAKEIVRRANAGKCQVTMVAVLTGENGGSTYLPLPNYYNVDFGTPAPIPRFATALDARSLRELELSRKGADSVSTFLGSSPDGKPSPIDQIVKSYQDIAQNLTAVGNAFSAVSASKGFALLTASLESQHPQAGDPAGQLRSQLRDIRRIIDSSPRLTDPSASESDIRKLAFMANALMSAAANLREFTAIDLSPARLNAFATTDAYRADPGTKALVDATRDLLTSLSRAQKTATSVQAAMRDLGEGLGLVDRINTSMQDEAKSLPDPKYLQTHAMDQLPDTTLRVCNYSNPRVELHPGDQIAVEVTVSRDTSGDGKASARAHGYQTFRLERYGLYSETRGGVLFVNPRSHIERDISYQPVPAVAYTFRYGIPNRPNWNHSLAPGIGFTLAMLDFTDDSDLELGLAANLSLLRDIFWVGYGRDLQAKANYAYLGLNIGALGGITR